jgi:hypothetical protein
MPDVILVDVLQTEIIHNQCEADGSPVMSPVPWRDLALAVSGLVKLLGKEVLRNDAGLRKAVHSSSHFTEDIAISVHLVTESVFLNDIGWE